MRKFMFNGLYLRGEMLNELLEIIADQCSSSEGGFASQETIGNVWRCFDCHSWGTC